VAQKSPDASVVPPVSGTVTPATVTVMGLADAKPVPVIVSVDPATPVAAESEIWDATVNATEADRPPALTLISWAPPVPAGAVKVRPPGMLPESLVDDPAGVSANASPS
jgi:hypothetical protein